MKTYYTPAYEEFHPGLEMEYRATIHGGMLAMLNNIPPTYSDAWSKGCLPKKYENWVDALNDYPAPSFGDIERYIKAGAIRIKHLDRFDLRECGCKEITLIPSRPSFKKGNYSFWLQKDHVVEIRNIHEDTVLFKGQIMNKTELKFQMKRLGIA